ncbi:(d)CMP kinase [Rhabdochlamydiaceae symbiont of Dictyostelium giganteum]|uniref:(d)CMP kinase n=1 Tax=Rhabdochlamydiaceae symbiont of Dictyostelium giganteum TaxID=3342349 RepID=UPI00384F7B5C
MIITIDGPAGTGKTTIAKRVAKELFLPYFDTGAMYRAVTYFFLDKPISLEDSESIHYYLKQFHFTLEWVGEEALYVVNDQDVTEQIRSQEVTEKVSLISAIPAVRHLLWDMQRAWAESQGGVFEGRDMGSVVFPHADFKFFLTAAPEIRARRRWMELQDKKIESRCSYLEILEQINQRDLLDSSRKLAPLQKPLKSEEIDTSHLTLEEVVRRIVTYCQQGETR